MKQVKVTAITDNGGSIESGWFVNAEQGEHYAAAMLNRGYIVARIYRNV